MSAATQNEMQRLRDQVRELECQNASLFNLLASIRTAAGDAEGGLMQDQLVTHIQRLSRARDERDEALERVEFLNQQNSAQQEQNDALKAHVEELSSNALALADACENKTDLPLHRWAVKCAILVSRVQASAKKLPSTKLARHDLIQQAQALEDYSANMPGGQSPAWRRMKAAAAELRQQAEGLL